MEMETDQLMAVHMPCQITFKLLI